MDVAEHLIRKFVPTFTTWIGGASISMKIAGGSVGIGYVGVGYGGVVESIK